MNINGIPGTPPGLPTPGEIARPRVDQGRAERAEAAVRQTAQPNQAASAASLGGTTQPASLPVAPPPGTDPELWSVLSAEERVFFAKVGAMGPLTYGRLSNEAPSAADLPWRPTQRESLRLSMDAISRVAQSATSLGGAQGSAFGATSPASAAGTGGPSFGDTLKQAIEKVSAAQDNSADHVAAFLRGDNVELHQVMAAAEEAGIALEMLIEVRNKFAEAYRTVINMQS